MIMWNGKITTELQDTAKQYGELFGIGPDCYSHVPCEDYEYEEFLLLIKLSIEQQTELPVTIDKLLGQMKFND